MSGLLSKDIEYRNKALSQVEKVNTADLFGSRALGNYKQGSAVDVAFIGEDIGFNELGLLDNLLNEEYPLPYFFDLIHYQTLSNPNLKEHIDQHGIIIYQKESSCEARSQFVPLKNSLHP